MRFFSGKGFYGFFFYGILGVSLVGLVGDVCVNI